MSTTQPDDLSDLSDLDFAVDTRTVTPGQQQAIDFSAPEYLEDKPPAASDATVSDDNFDITLDESAVADTETPCYLVTGCAGTGKSYLVRGRIDEDPTYAVLSASTGISAVNLSTTTIHSLLGFFDTDSLRDAYLQGSAQRKLRKIAQEGYRNIVVDEVSMISDATLDLLVRIFDDVNANLGAGQLPIGLVLTGDFAQLPPIADKPHGGGRQRGGARVPWAFEAANWHRFERNITHLTKVWRQSDQKFLAALNYARSGRGQESAGLLRSSGVQFHTALDIEFDGTTIVSQNTEVDRYNQIALDRVRGRLISLPSRRWGKQRGEWKNIPDRTIVKEGAYVMLLANRKINERDFEFVNGDCGHVRSIQPSLGPGSSPKLVVELVRNGQEVYVDSLVRGVESKDKPEGVSCDASADSKNQYLDRPHYNSESKRYVSGQVQYWPVRLAYATTVHKSQGVSLDRCQIDMRNWMMARPAMMYVSLSRCRTLEGLRLVGMPEVMSRNCKVDSKVTRWL